MRQPYLRSELIGAAVGTNLYGYVYDFWWQAVSVETPLGVTSNFYDGAASRVLNSIYVAGPICRETRHLYNDLGEQVDTVQDGITNRTDVAYEFFSNHWWKVTRESTVGPGTNALTTVREQLTGLEDGLRSRTVKSTLGGATVLTETRYDEQTGILTTTTRSSNASDTIEHSRCGIVLDSAKDGVVTFAAHDALGRTVYTERSPTNGTVRTPVARMEYNGLGDLVRLQTYTNGTDVVVESYAYDAFGNRFRVEDALGNVVETVYDVAGNVVAESGATYPIRQEFDTQGRRIALCTTRDGIVWDVTRWTYDAATGLCTSKTYADGSVVTYTHTSDGLPLRTTLASGKWRECVYDDRRRLVGMAYSSSAMSWEFGLDAFGRMTNAVDSTGNLLAYAYATGTSPTNEMWCASGRTNRLTRVLDASGRPSGCSFFVNDVQKGGIGYAYGSDGRVAVITATNAEGRSFTASYVNGAGYNFGYEIRTPNGGTLRRTVLRDSCRRSLVTGCDTCFGDMTLDSYRYAFDAVGRPVRRNADDFSYDGRSQVISAVIGTNVFTHAYDEIGNHVLSGENACTNLLVNNSLNQTILSGGGSISWNADGGMAFDGRWTYSYDAEDQLVSIVSRQLTNGAIRVLNAYDHCGRRISKTVQRYNTDTLSWAFRERHDFIYDGWNVIHEFVTTLDAVTEIQYFWGTDLSDSLQGAGGVGGLLAVSVNGQFYFPFYDNNGNVTKYVDEFGAVVAAYVYDDFGNTIEQAGTFASFFRHRFSTKYFDVETGLYYYGQRFLHPLLRCWLNRDPVEERGGNNLYAFVGNAALRFFDPYGNERVTLRYDTIEPTVHDRVVNWATTYDLNLSQIGVDILLKIDPYSKTGKGKCKCIDHFLLAGHGSQGLLFIAPHGGFVNSVDVDLMRMGIKNPELPKGAYSLFKIVKQKMCEHGTVEFVTCYSGEGIEGDRLRNSLQNYFGRDINVVLYLTPVKYYFNRAVQSR